MSQFLPNVKRLRSDLSEWLIHFTCGTREEASATLEKIISDQALRSFKEPYVISFSEAPLIELNKLFKLYQNYTNPRFAPFGIAVRKNWLFDLGGRPCIYSPKSEFEFIKDKQKFRLVKFSPPECDFSWQREWCINTNELKLVPENSLVIVPDEEAAFGLAYDVEVDYEYEGFGEVSTHGWIERSWYSVSLADLPKTDGSGDPVIAKLIDGQTLT